MDTRNDSLFFLESLTSKAQHACILFWLNMISVLNESTDLWQGNDMWPWVTTGVYLKKKDKLRVYCLIKCVMHLLDLDYSFQVCRQAIYWGPSSHFLVRLWSVISSVYSWNFGWIYSIWSGVESATMVPNLIHRASTLERDGLFRNDNEKISQQHSHRTTVIQG